MRCERDFSSRIIHACMHREDGDLHEGTARKVSSESRDKRARQCVMLYRGGRDIFFPAR